MEEIITKELAKKLMKFKGEVRGAVFKADIKFIIEEEGEEGLRKIEEEMEKLGCPFKYDEISTTRFYPKGIGWRTISLLVMKKLFGFSDKKIIEMGIVLPKSIFFLRFIAKYFSVNLKIFYNQTPKMWKKFISVGELILVKFDEKNKVAIVRIKEDLRIHPILCPYLVGMTIGFAQLLTGSSKASCRETDCVFKGSDYHEFYVTW